MNRAERFLEIKWVSNAFQGIKIAVAILVMDAAIKMIAKAVWGLTKFSKALAAR